jgi:glutamate decarboxylase
MAAGLGMNNMIQVAGDRMTGVMLPEALDEAIREQKALGKTPFFVNSVGGSTVMGSFDDQHAISAVCKEHGLWHHIDGCWGGIMAFSDKHKHLYAGSHLADSVAINAHKAFGVPNQCSYLLLNNRPHALAAANTSGATYLFHDSEYSKYDRADKTLSCGRRADGLKLWMALKRHGLDGMAKLADFSMEKAAYITQQIKAQPDKFEMINEPMATNICFSYTPPAFRGKDYTWEQKANVHRMIFDRMLVDGVMLIQHNPLEEFNLPNFFRLTLKNEKSRIEDMDFILEKIDALGQDIDQSMV